MGKQTDLTAEMKYQLRLPIGLIIIFVIFNVAIYFCDTTSGALLSCGIAIYLAVIIPSYFTAKKRLLSSLIDFATHYGTVQKRILDEFSVPYALLDDCGKVLWMNREFEAISKKDKTYHKSINGIISSITKEWLQKQNVVTMDQHITLDKREYLAKFKKIYINELIPPGDAIPEEIQDDYMISICMFDETDLNSYIRKNRQQRLVTALVYIDNYEELMESVEDMKTSMLSALVTRRISKYFSAADAIIKQTDKDKFFIIFKYEYLQKFIDDNFSIIEEIKRIKMGNEMAITLSIGIGVNDGTYVQNASYSRTAIDLALGRGGDQVVIKDKEDISYYGGKTQQVEKNTRVKARVKAHALRELMSSGSNILIMGHKLGDVDSFGAAIGIFCAARTLDKKAQIVIEDVTAALRPFKQFFTSENGYPEDMFLNREQAIERCDSNTILIVVDTNRAGHVECEALLSKTNTIVVFDHHRRSKNDIEGAVLSYIESYASSTCEMVAEMLRYISEDIKLDTLVADTMYAGILIDTNNFVTKTGVRTFEAAAYLKRCGADVNYVRKLLRNDITSYKARAEAVRTAEVYKGVFAIAQCPSEGLESPTVVGAQAANELLNIIGIKASFVLTSYMDKIFISSRSIDEINVQLIMERMGGGGHLSVAGAQLKDATLQEARAMLTETIDKLIEEQQIQI